LSRLSSPPGSNGSRGASPACLEAVDIRIVTQGLPELARIWRVLTPPELRHTPRVAAFFDFIVEEMEALRPVLTG